MGFTNNVLLLGILVVLEYVQTAPSFLRQGSADCRNNPNRLYPHPTSCDYFLQCVHGTPIQMPCAPGTEFSVLYQVCVFRWQSDCKINQSKEDEYDEPPEDVPASEPGNNEDQQQEEITESSAPPAESTQSSTSQSVTFSSEAPATTERSASTPKPGTDDGDPNLPPGPENGDSGTKKDDDLTPEIPGDEAKEDESQDSPWKEENSENNDDDDNDEEFDPTSVCLRDPGSYFITADLKDCTRYIMCTFGEGYYGKCREGQYFSPIFTTCSSDRSVC